jgi:hypothetical protein
MHHISHQGSRHRTTTFHAAAVEVGTVVGEVTAADHLEVLITVAGDPQPARFQRSAVRPSQIALDYVPPRSTRSVKLFLNRSRERWQGTDRRPNNVGSHRPRPRRSRSHVTQFPTLADLCAELGTAPAPTAGPPAPPPLGLLSRRVQHSPVLLGALLVAENANLELALSGPAAWLEYTDARAWAVALRRPLVVLPYAEVAAQASAPVARLCREHTLHVLAIAGAANAVQRGYGLGPIAAAIRRAAGVRLGP